MTEIEKVQPGEVSESQVQTPVYMSSLHTVIRTKLDPSSEWLSDDNIKRIERISAGNRRRVVHKCLLGMLYKAQRGKNAEAAVAFRHKLMAFEAGRLVL
jgi:hypothetical protein